MTARDKDLPPGGLTLAEAIERYSDPAVWRAYQDAAPRVTSSASYTRSPFMLEDVRYEIGAENFRPVRSKPTGPNPQVKERNRLWEELQSVFLDKLRSGSLVATGYVWPLSPDSERIRIAPHLWEFLRPSFNSGTRSVARAGDLKFVRVLVHSEQDAPEIIPEEPGIEVRRQPGRPSQMDVIENEMRRRAAAGQMKRSLPDECEALAKWYNARHPKPYKAASIKRRLSSVYRELSGAKK